jgi:hypothetical protein
MDFVNRAARMDFVHLCRKRCTGRKAKAAARVWRCGAEDPQVENAALHSARAAEDSCVRGPVWSAFAVG